MKIIKLLYLKYILSFSICLISSYVIFFIFSLLGNLNEDYLFNIIVNLSLLNSLQILMYVPSFIFFISVILLTIFLKSKNEIIIIKSYMNLKKMMIFFLPIVFFFMILEVNKNGLITLFEDSKNSLINKNYEHLSKILIDKSNDTKIITVMKKIDLKNLENAEYRFYKIFDKKIKVAQFSNNLVINDNKLILENYIEYKNNLIKNYNAQKVINISLIDLVKDSTIVHNITYKNNFNFNVKLINIMIFFILFFNYVFLIFTSKKFVDTKENLSYPVSICLFFLFYSFFIFNNSLSAYKQEFEILASIVIGMLFFKQAINE